MLEALLQGSQNVAKITRFRLFLNNQWWNRSRFSAFAILHCILTEKKQAKPGRFQIRSLKKITLHSLHSRNSTENTYFTMKILFPCSQTFRMVFAVV